MKNLIMDVVYASVTTIWNEKIISGQILVFIGSGHKHIGGWSVLLGLDHPGWCNPVLSVWRLMFPWWDHA